MIRGELLIDRLMTIREMFGLFLFLFVYVSFVGCVYVFTLISCIFVAHVVIFNLFYKSLLVVILDFCFLLGVWVVLEINFSNSYLGWLSISFWILEIDLELIFACVSELNVFRISRRRARECRRELYGSLSTQCVRDGHCCERYVMILMSIVCWV